MSKKTGKGSEFAEKISEFAVEAFDVITTPVMLLVLITGIVPVHQMNPYEEMEHEEWKQRKREERKMKQKRHKRNS